MATAATMTSTGTPSPLSRRAQFHTPPTFSPPSRMAASSPLSTSAAFTTPKSALAGPSARASTSSHHQQQVSASRPNASSSSSTSLRFVSPASTSAAVSPQPSELRQAASPLTPSSPASPRSSALSPSSPRSPSASSSTSFSKTQATAGYVGRGEVAYRLRINAVALFAWYVTARSSLYTQAAAYLVQLAPSLDSPLHFLESSFTLLLFWNIAEAMWRLNTSTAAVVVPAPSRSGDKSPSPLDRRSPAPAAHVLLRSSPKTRPASAAKGSPELMRSMSRASPRSSASTPTGTPARTLGGAPSPASASSLGGASPLLARSSAALSTRSSLLGTPASGKSTSSVIDAYMARHSPTASRLHRSVGKADELVKQYLDE